MDMSTDRHDRARRVRYQAALDALAVETNPRYQANRQGLDETYCNLFVADATRQLGVPIPLYVVNAAGETIWLGANEMQDWLRSEAAAPHWRAVGPAEAQRLANTGCPVVATWHSPGGIGHMAMVRPGPEPVGAGGPWVAHAGAHNAAHTDVATAFGGGPERLAAVIYFAAVLPAG